HSSKDLRYKPGVTQRVCHRRTAMLACTYQQLREARSQKLVAAASIFCHPIGLPSLLRVKPSPRGRAEQSEIRSDEENRRRLRSRRRRARITGIADEKRTAAARAARTTATSERTEVASTTRVAAVPPAAG